MRRQCDGCNAASTLTNTNVRRPPPALRLPAARLALAAGCPSRRSTSINSALRAKDPSTAVRSFEQTEIMQGEGELPWIARRGSNAGSTALEPQHVFPRRKQNG